MEPGPHNEKGTEGGRETYIFDNLTTACEDRQTRWEEALRRASPTDMYEVIVSDLSSAASPVYKSASCQPARSDKVKARDAALHDRREARNACSKFSTAHISHCKSSTVQEFLGLLVNAWKCQVRLDIASRKIRIATAALKAETAEMWANEIDEAWGKRESSRAYRLARQLAGCKKGAKRRWGRMPITANPSRKQFAEFLSKPATQGGWGATVCETPVGENNFSETPLLPEHTNKAYHDYNNIRWAARQSPNRRGVPSWDIPAEIWRMALWPNYTLGYMRWGVGSTRTYEYPQDLKGRVFKLCEAIRRSQCLPAQFCTSQGFRVHKKSLPHIDDSGAVSDCRIVHSFCSFSKFYMKMASKSAGWSKPFISAYGAVEGGRKRFKYSF